MVKIDQHISRVFEAVIGLPQGSSLAPALFKFFMFDLPQPGANMRISGFADDLLVAAWDKPARAKIRMERYLERLNVFYNQNAISVNVNKSKSLLITGTLNRLTKYTRIECQELKVKMNGEWLQKTDSLRYLGIQLNEKWSLIEHVSNSMGRVSSVMGAMKGLLSKRGMLSDETKLAFYKSAIRPVISYGFPIWNNISSHQMEKLRIAERKYLRWTRADKGGAPGSYKLINSSRVYEDAKIKRLDVWMYELYKKSFDRFASSSNHWMEELFSEESKRRALANEKYRPPEWLYFENQRVPLIDQHGKFLVYNKRIRDGGSIYVEAQ